MNSFIIHQLISTLGSMSKEGEALWWCCKLLDFHCRKHKSSALSRKKLVEVRSLETHCGAYSSLDSNPRRTPVNHNKTDPKSTKVDIIRVELDGIAVNLEYKSTCLSSQAQIQKSLFLQHHETWLYKSLISGGATSAMGKCFPKLHFPELCCRTWEPSAKYSCWAL